MPPEQDRRKRRPFDDADEGNAPGNVAADDQGDAERRELIRKVEKQTGLPAFDPIATGPAAMVDALLGVRAEVA